MPEQKLEQSLWMHPHRLPLGAGWRGCCQAPGHEGCIPSEQELAQGCNLGYAKHCSRLPAQRSCDAVRFSIARDLGSRILVAYACEAGHLPAGHGILEYDAEVSAWVTAHKDPRILKMAECYLDSYLLRRVRPDEAGSAAIMTS